MLIAHKVNKIRGYYSAPGEGSYIYLPYFFKHFIHLFERDREHHCGEGVEGEADSPLSRKPDAGLSPRTPGS